jgi:hypothetical protein
MRKLNFIDQMGIFTEEEFNNLLNPMVRTSHPDPVEENRIMNGDCSMVITDEMLKNAPLRDPHNDKRILFYKD